MGSTIELNDTLLLTPEQGFPADLLDWQVHRRAAIESSRVAGMVFEFSGKAGARVFHLAPTRVYLVQNIAKKWLFWGHALIVSQSIQKALGPDGGWTGQWTTSGSFTISDLYEPDYQERFTRRESPPGSGFEFRSGV
jgi:hypothetical protein